jgi:fatty acid desaturase
MAKDSEVYSISSVGMSTSDDQASRNRRYMLSMSIRVICFAAAVWVEGWLRWVLLAGSLVLPWIAVVVANAGRENGRNQATFTTPESGKELL